MNFSFLALAAAISLAVPAFAGQHFGNNALGGGHTAGSVPGNSGTTDPDDGSEGGGTVTGGLRASCPEEPDGVNDPRRGKPLCGQPPTPACNAPPGAACSMIAPAPRTYPHCAALIVANATLLHFGRCQHEPAPEPKRIAIGFEVKNMRQCISKVSHAKRLKPKLAPWLQADGKPMRTREFCKRLFGDEDVPLSSGAAEDPDDDAENGDELGQE